MFIGSNIRYLRKKLGLSQEDLAARLGYKSFTTIQKWESGGSTPPLKTCVVMCELFDVELDDIVRKDLSAVKKDLHLAAAENPEFDDYEAVSSK